MTARVTTARRAVGLEDTAKGAVVRHLVVALVLALVATIIFVAALVQRQIAEGQHHVATRHLNRAAGVFDEVHDRLRYAQNVPWLFRGTRHEVEGRRAAVRYWRREYGSLVAEYPDLGRPDIRENVPLQLTLASAYLRAGEVTAGGDPQVLLGELDRAINVYSQVLRHTDGDRDAAFNYEYLVRLRDDIAAGGEVPLRRPPSPLGRPGDNDEMDMEDISDVKVYVPADMLDREASDEPTLGSDAPLRRRG